MAPKKELVVTKRHRFNKCGDPITSERKLRDMVEAYKDFPEFVFDVETLATREKRYEKDGPQGDPHTNEVFWISFAGPGRCDVIPLGHPTDKGGPTDQLWRSVAFPILEPLLYNTTQRKVGANTKFDVMSLAKYFDGEPMPPPYGDVLVEQHILNENLGMRGYSVLACTQRHLGHTYEKIGKNVWEHPYLDASRYSYFDSKNEWLLHVKFMRDIERLGLMPIFDLEMGVLEVVIAMEMEGAPVDVAHLEVVDKDLDKRKLEIEYRIWDANGGTPFNLNASAACGKFVYDMRGHKPKHYTPKTGARSTKADHLAEYAKKDPLVQAMLDWAKLDKLQGTYVKGLVPKVTPAGRLHADFRQTGTVTGRFSSSQPNLQNIPSRSEDGKEIRYAFWAGPDE